ncbi:GNAT family N-acetyltransferase [Natronomonas salsuginis]|jgi:ribosomal protein S18 acetylase RimI-like enzyme|uniref:GNAT family N-acetyltransferase n=1 Tax=Natronomonas salsuginis TaxID=2217661 RepID=A0A4V5ZNH0_9EURY|nr:GNAT family N-acetyltransferase [Natronomonas salsuginis]TKR25253.1 GNAT family N-acetyltransferase [Natronomonas salsuginis]
MTVRVREAADDDVGAILDVAEAAWYAAYGGALDPSTIAAALVEYYDPELIEAGIDHDAIAFYVAEVDGAVVGFASAEQTWADEVELHTLYVHPDRWGEGIGSALLDRVTEWAREAGVDRITCGVLGDNAIGIGFFEAVGFRRGRRADAEIVGATHEEYEYEYDLRET